MAKRRSNRLAITALSLVGLPLLAIATDRLFGTPIATIVVIGALLWLVWRLDNAVGAFLPLAVLFLIVLTILGLLIGGLAFVHQLTAG